MKKQIAILGSTGSIGTQALEVIKNYPEQFEVKVLTTNTNANLIIKQAIEFHPEIVVICDESKYKIVSEALSSYNIKVFAGKDAILDVIQISNIDLVLNALVGYSGFKPSLKAIESGKNIALANKETLVIGGEIITRKAKQNNIIIFPVDSEHSAIFQCIMGENNNTIEKIYLTASGGPFYNKDYNFIRHATREQALQHPNWSMGNKITIDSATLLNKGLEVIEARWLFNLKPEQIKVVIHPQSIVHSIVQFEDGSMKAQLSLPDMKIPILFALSYPKRFKTNFERLDFLSKSKLTLTFEQPDTNKFPSLQLAYEALEKGGNMPCILNASSEIAVDAFLNNKINFIQIPKIIEKCMRIVSYIRNPRLEDFDETNEETRKVASSLITKINIE